MDLIANLFLALQVFMLFAIICCISSAVAQGLAALKGDRPVAAAWAATSVLFAGAIIVLLVVISLQNRELSPPVLSPTDLRNLWLPAAALTGVSLGLLLSLYLRR